MSVNARKAQTWMAEQWLVIRGQWIVLAVVVIVVILVWIPIPKLQAIGFICAFLGILTFSWWYSHITRQTLRRPLRDRERLPPEAIYAMAFAVTGVRKETVAEIWQTIARQPHVERGQLRPSNTRQWLSTF